MKNAKSYLIIAFIIAFSVLPLVSCGGVEPASTPTPPIDLVAEGKQLFSDKGCAAWYGPNGDGTNIASALPGHNAEEVKRQVRSPVGSMPSSGPELISDDELEIIAEYIGSLEHEDEHIEPVDMDNALVMHHWMALYALESDNQAEAEHHVHHILELVTNLEHEIQMEEVIEHLQAGDLHDASHAIEEMLAGKAEPELLLKDLHLQLALAALKTEELEDAKHHLEHFVNLATGDEKGRGEEITDLLEQGNIHDAENEMEELLK